MGTRTVALRAFFSLALGFVGFELRLLPLLPDRRYEFELPKPVRGLEPPVVDWTKCWKVVWPCSIESDGGMTTRECAHPAADGDACTGSEVRASRVNALAELCRPSVNPPEGRSKGFRS